MSDIRPIFWSQIDKCIREFTLNNKPLQRISKIYPVYFVYSGKTDYIDSLKKVYPNATFIPCAKNDDNIKAKILFELLKNKTDYDVLIRICCDAVIVDVQKLLDILKNNLLGKHAIIGNVATNKDGTPNHLRGGCVAVSRSVIDRIDMITEPIESLPPKVKSIFDKDFSFSVMKTGAEIVSYHLFEVGIASFFDAPVCHPTRYRWKNRLRNFLEIVDMAEKKEQSKKITPLNQLTRKNIRTIRWGSHVSLHRAILRSFPITGILELGAGFNSTKEFFNTKKQVISIENDDRWIKELRKTLVENDSHKIVHHVLPDLTITRGTSYQAVSGKIKSDAIDFYKSFITKETNMLFIDNYTCFRLEALQALYSKFDIITFHDVEDSKRYGYDLFQNNDKYIQYIDKTFIAHTGLLIKPSLNNYIENFLGYFKIESEKRALELNVSAPFNIVRTQE